MEYGNYTYILILVARNEETYIQKTLDSITKQTILPKALEIVLNDCTDGTETIVKSFCQKFSWIRFSLYGSTLDRNYANKANAVNIAYKKFTDIEFDFIGNIDADVVLQPSYYQLIMQKFYENEKLGIAGGHFYEIGNNRIKKNLEYYELSVSGMVQLFRRECFEQIDGYRPITTGGEDMVAEILARCKGWQTRTYPEILFLHNRHLGTADASILIAKFREGIRDCVIGYHPVFYFVKCIRRVFEKPLFLGSLMRGVAFLYASFKFKHKVLDTQAHHYFHAEQKNRLVSLLCSPIKCLRQISASSNH